MTRRAAVIAVAIDARRRRYPDEQTYASQPFAGCEDGCRFDNATVDRVIRVVPCPLQ